MTAVWTYVGELAFNLLVLVGAIKGCDRIVKEIMDCELQVRLFCGIIEPRKELRLCLKLFRFVI